MLDSQDALGLLSPLLGTTTATTTGSNKDSSDRRTVKTGDASSNQKQVVRRKSERLADTLFALEIIVKYCLVDTFSNNFSYLSGQFLRGSSNFSDISLSSLP